MPALVWDKVDERDYELGVDWGTLYDENHTNGVAWNGLVSVDSSRDAEALPLSFDEIKYLDAVSESDLKLTLSAFSMPIELSPCLGYEPVVEGFYLTRQPRRSFGLAYRSHHSDETYELHLVYNATIAPSSLSHSTISSNIEPSTLQFEINTRPNPSTTYRPTSHIVVDSGKVDPGNLAILEDILFGSHQTALIDGGPAKLWWREPLSGGVPTNNSAAVVINGGVPSTAYAYWTPTLITPAEVRSVLEGS